MIVAHMVIGFPTILLFSFFVWGVERAIFVWPWFILWFKTSLSVLVENFKGNILCSFFIIWKFISLSQTYAVLELDNVDPTSLTFTALLSSVTTLSNNNSNTYFISKLIILSTLYVVLVTRPDIQCKIILADFSYMDFNFTLFSRYMWCGGWIYISVNLMLFGNLIITVIRYI